MIPRHCTALMKSNSRLAVLFTTLLLIVAGKAKGAVVVNIEAKASFAGAYSGQGAYADPGNNSWNSFRYISGGSSLLASNGTPTSLSFSGTAVNGGPDAGFGGGDNGLLLADYWYVYGRNVGTFTVGGLTSGNAYSVYVYSQAGSSGATDRAATITLGSASQNLTGLAGAGGSLIRLFAELFGHYRAGGSLVAGQNYVVFNISSLSGTSLNGTFATLTGSGEAELNGLQIVDLGPGSGGSSSTVPDASTSGWLVGLALLGCAAGQRRLRAAVRS
jgi:hypothetical protein